MAFKRKYKRKLPIMTFNNLSFNSYYFIVLRTILLLRFNALVGT